MWWCRRIRGITEAHWRGGRSTPSPGSGASKRCNDSHLRVDRALLAFVRTRRPGSEHVRFARPVEPRHFRDVVPERGPTSPRTRTSRPPARRRSPHRRLVRASVAGSQSGSGESPARRNPLQGPHSDHSTASDEALSRVTASSARSEEAPFGPQAGPPSATGRIGSFVTLLVSSATRFRVLLAARSVHRQRHSCGSFHRPWGAAALVSFQGGCAPLGQSMDAPPRAP